MKKLIIIIILFFLSSCTAIYNTEISPERWRYPRPDDTMFLIDLYQNNAYIIEVEKYRWIKDNLIIRYSHFDDELGLYTKRQYVIYNAKDRYTVQRKIKSKNVFNNDILSTQFVDAKRQTLKIN